MTSAFSSAMSPAEVDSFLSQMERPARDGAQSASNRLGGISIPIPQGDDPFSAGNNGSSSNAPFTAPSGPGFPDDSDEDDAALLLPGLVYPSIPTREETIAKHVRLTTVYDPLNPPPDDEDTRQGTALGLRPDYDGRLFHHQTLRLGRWCHMTDHRVDRSELLDAEKEMLDWKFEQPAPRCRIPSNMAEGRGCMGAYLQRRNRIPRYEVTRRRASAIRRPRKSTTGTKRPQDGKSAVAAAAAAGPKKSPGHADRSEVLSSRGTFFTETSSNEEDVGPTSPQKRPKSSATALAEAFSEWNAKKARGEPVGTPQDVLAAVAKRSSATSSSAPLPPASPGRSAPKSPTTQQQGSLPPRFLLPNGRVNIAKVLDEQMEFIGNGGRADAFFAQYPGLQESMARPNQNVQANSSTITPPPTTKRPTSSKQKRPDRVSPTQKPPNRRGASVAEVDAAGNEIIVDDDDGNVDDDAALPFARQRGTTKTPSKTKTNTISSVNPAFPSSSSLSSPPSARKRERGGGGGGAAGGATSVKSLRLNRTGAASKRTVAWAPLPGEQGVEHPDDGEENEDDDVEEIPREEIQRPWSPGGALSAERARRGQYGWR